MADDQTSTLVAAQPEADEGFLHSLATSLGIDPEAVVQTAKAIRANPIQTLKEVGGQQVQELEDAAASPLQTAKTVAKGVGDLLTNPEAQSTAISRLKAPGVVNKLQGAGEYASSLVPLIGSGLVKSEEQAGKGNLAGSAGTLTGTVGPLLTDTEGGEALKEHLAETAKTGIESAKEEISKAVNAKAPKGSTEAGAVKLGEAPNGEDAIKVFTDSLGIKWAENPDGVRVSIPKRIPDEEVPNYASQKLSEQVAGRADLKKQVLFDSVGGKQVKPPDTPAAGVQPDIKSEGPEWDRVHSAFVDGKKVGSVGYKLDPEGRAQIYGSQVSPDLRGQGVGQKLYRQAIDDAQAAGASRITSDFTNTSPDANRVWEKLRDKGLPVEEITHPNGKPGYQIDFENPAEPTPPQAPAPQFEQTLAARGQLPNQKVNLSPAYGETGKYVGGLVSARPPEGVSPLDHYNTVVGSTTGPALMEIPPDLMTEGGTTHDAITHELGHAVAMDLTGLPTASSEIRSHLHPDIFDRGAAANISTDWSSLPGVTRNIMTGNLHFPKEALQHYWPNFLQTYLGGGVAQELVHGIPIAENEGMHGDLQVLHSIGKSMGFTPEETQDMIAAGVHKTRALLNHPETLDIIKREAGQREEGLPRTLHASAAKVQDVIRQVREARNAANTTAGGEANGGVNEKTQPSGTGPNPEKNIRSGNGSSVSSEEIPTGADSRKIKNPISEIMASPQGYGTTNDPLEAGFILGDGRMVPLIKGAEHNDMIALAGGESLARNAGDIARHDEKGLTRERIIEDEGTIRTRYLSTKSGKEVVFSVPSSGVTPEQIEQMKKSVAAMGRNGSAVIEVGDPMLAAVQNTKKDFVRPSDIEPMLREIKAHPDKTKSKPIPRVMKQSGSEDMSDPELAFNAARHEAGHAVISEALNPGTVSSMALDENGGKTIVNAPNGKQTVGALSPDELRDMVATSLAGGMTEPGGTTVEHASGDVRNRGTLLGPAADTWQQQLGRLVMPAQGVPNDPMLQNNQTLAESKARVTALLADPKVRKNIDTVAAHLAAKKNLSGDEVRAIIQKK